jgi:pre-mRNA-processing factor 40
MSVGRGRASTLPAWMTGGVPGASPSPAPVAAPVAPMVAASSGVVPGAYTAMSLPAVAPSTYALASQPAPYQVRPALPVQTTAASSSGWTEHKGPDGRAYYHHAATAVSTYEKPDALKTEAERSAGKCVWTEHSAPDGRKYYYNATTKASVWVEPPELTEYKARIGGAKPVNAGGSFAPAAIPQSVAARPTGFAQAAAAPTVAPSPAPAATKSIPEGSKGAAASGYANLTEEEKLTKFKEMLRDKTVRSDARWSEVLPIIQHDKRYGLLKTQGERRQAFSEYQTARQKEEREEGRKKGQLAKDAFVSLLATRKDVVNGTALFRDVEAALANEPAWKNLGDLQLRRDLFTEYVTELAKKEKEEKRKDQEEKESAFFSLLKSRPDLIHVNARWADVKPVLSSELAYQNVSKDDRVRLYKDYILALEREEESRRRTELDKERSRLNDIRHEVLELLRALAHRGLITARSRWADFEELVSSASSEPSESEYSKIKSLKDELGWAAAAVHAIKNSGAPPAEGSDKTVATTGDIQLRELFEDAVAEADKVYRSDRRILHEMVEDARVDWILPEAVTVETTLDEFIAKLTAAWVLAVDKFPTRYSTKAVTGKAEDSSENAIAALKRLRPWNFDLIFHDLQNHAAEAAAEAERKRKKQRSRFEELLMDYFYRSDHIDINWEEAKEMIRHRSAYQESPVDQRQHWFDAYMTRLRAKAQARKARLLAERAAAQQEEPAGRGPAADVEEGEEPEAATSSTSAMLPEVLIEGTERQETDGPDAEAPSHAGTKRQRTDDMEHTHRQRSGSGESSSAHHRSKRSRRSESPQAAHQNSSQNGGR